ncbi:MAG: TRAP transporter large permease subunit, partial [Firmicutes bacterium]|nr:TRAP transporter large permease subunit [Candidatus Fermentithermobacillaceae bacterium]
WRNFGSRFKESFLALMMPAIILGGILLGVVTPTEAAVLATVYALVVGLFVSKELKWEDLPGIFIESATTTAVTMFMIAGAFLYGWIVTREQVPARVAEALAGFSSNPTVILMLFSVIYLFAGTILDLGANIIIFVPVLYPITQMAGIDPLHFGVVTVVALAIGLITPPVGACLFIACEISGSTLVEASKAMLPFIVALILVLLLIIVFPGMITLIPNLIIN